MSLDPELLKAFGGSSVIAVAATWWFSRTEKRFSMIDLIIKEMAKTTARQDYNDREMVRMNGQLVRIERKLDRVLENQNGS